MMGGSQRQDQCAQELRLAGTGCTDEHSVRTSAELSTLLDVQVHDVAGLQLMPERDPQPITVGVGEHPPPAGGDLLHRLGTDQLVPLGGDLLVYPDALVDDV